MSEIGLSKRSSYQNVVVRSSYTNSPASSVASQSGQQTPLADSSEKMLEEYHVHENVDPTSITQPKMKRVGDEEWSALEKKNEHMAGVVTRLKAELDEALTEARSSLDEVQDDLDRERLRSAQMEKQLERKDNDLEVAQIEILKLKRECDQQKALLHNTGVREQEGLQRVKMLDDEIRTFEEKSDKQIVAMGHESKALKFKVLSLTQELETKTQALIKMESQYDQLQASVMESQKDAETNKSSVEQLTKELQEVKGHLTATQLREQDGMKKIRELEKEIALEHAKATGHTGKLTAEIENFREALERSQRELQETKSARSATSKEFQLLQKKCRDLEHEQNSRAAEFRRMKDDMTRMKAELAWARQKEKDAVQQIQVLEADARKEHENQRKNEHLVKEEIGVMESKIHSLRDEMIANRSRPGSVAGSLFSRPGSRMSMGSQWSRPASAASRGPLDPPIQPRFNERGEEMHPSGWGRDESPPRTTPYEPHNKSAASILASSLETSASPGSSGLPPLKAATKSPDPLSPSPILPGTPRDSMIPHPPPRKSNPYGTPV